MGINHTPGPWIVYGAPGNVWAPFDQKNVANAYIADRDRETQSANARLIAEAPAMLAALREAVARVTLANSEGEPILSAWLPDAAAILSRIDGTPTAQPAGDDPAVTAAANLSRTALVEAAGEALALQAPTAEPAAPISEAGDHCASCGAEEGESHGAQCEARGFAMGAEARRLDTGALRSVAGDDAAWLEATAGRDGGED